MTMEATLCSYLGEATLEKAAGVKADAPPTVRARAARVFTGAMFSILCALTCKQSESIKIYGFLSHNIVYSSVVE